MEVVNIPKFSFSTDAGGSAGVILRVGMKVKIYGRIVSVPAKFVSDGMSIPWLFQPLIGRPFDIPFVYPAILHDYFYRMQTVDRHFADVVFLLMLRRVRVPKWKCMSIFYSLRLFGWIAWNQNKKKENKT